MSDVTRRWALGALGVTVLGAAVGVPLVSGIRGSSSTGALLPSGRPLPEQFAAAFRLPPVLAPVRSDATTDYYELVQRQASADLLPGVRTPIWGYNGVFPGPTIVSRPGRAAVVRHRNELPVPVVVHLHGGRVPADQDGYPNDYLLPAGMSPEVLADAGAVTVLERDYRYPPQPRAATLWYHDHRMDHTAPAVWNGLAGFHLVQDEHEASLPLPREGRDLLLMIADRSFAADGSMPYPDFARQHPDAGGHEHGGGTETVDVPSPYSAGVLGDVILVNGVPWPTADVDGARYRLRILNASNARRYRLRLDPAPRDDSGLVQIGSDHGLLATPVRHDAIEMAPAERVELVVDFAQYEPGREIRLVNEFGQGSTEAVMRFRVGDRADDASRIPDQLAELETLHAEDSVVTRTMVFRSQDIDGMSGWTINGEPFTTDHIHAHPVLGQLETWRLVSDFHHPVHLHLSPFQILSRGTGGPGPYDSGWKDTIDLRPAEEAAILVRFEEYEGKFVFHCHNLEHEDMMMMGNFRTTPAS